jgi:antitoxin VapB
MALSIRDKETDAAVRRLAALKKMGLTETIREAVQNELKRAEQTTPLMDRISQLQAEVRARPLTGLHADKEFYDRLNDE